MLRMFAPGKGLILAKIILNEKKLAFAKSVRLQPREKQHRFL